MTRKQPDINDLLSGLHVPAKHSKAEAWEALQFKLELQQTRLKPRSYKQIRLGLLTTAAAAIIILIFTIVSIKSSVNYEASLTENRDLVLPDSTLVKLKKNSSLSFHHNPINGNRSVELNGEAFFDVSSGEKFKVSFPGGKLVVLGTEFSILVYSEEMGRIDCYEGTVRVEIGSLNYTLTAGKSIHIKHNQVEGPFDLSKNEQMPPVDNRYSWTNRPLSEVLGTICAREGFQLQTPDRVLSMRFTGTLDLSDHQQALTILTRAMNLEFKLNQTKLEVVAKD